MLWQAEKVDMQQELTDLEAELSELQVQKNGLAGYNITLEKAVSFKDHEIAKLQERNHVSAASSCDS